jgi:hypothetical protein
MPIPATCARRGVSARGVEADLADHLAVDLGDQRVATGTEAGQALLPRFEGRVG